MGKKSIKGFKKVSWFRILITVLILAIGLVFGVKLVQQSQENRSKAAFVLEGNGGNSSTTCTPGSIKCAGPTARLICEGPGATTWRSYSCENKTVCIGGACVMPKLGQICGNYGLGVCIKTTSPVGSSCKVGSTDKIGKVTSGYCSGDNTIRCCQQSYR